MFRQFLLLALFAYAAAFGPAAMRALKKNVAVVGVAAAALAPGAAFAKDLDNGAAVFSGNCAACHAGGNNVIQNEKTLRKEALEQYLAGGLKESSIVTQVTNGKNAMPAFGGRLDDEEIEDVAAYVYDQATNAKWD
jgi:cytochrome c6